MTNPCSRCEQFCDELKGNMRIYCDACKLLRVIEKKAIQKAYFNNPEVKAKQKVYQKAYRDQPEVKDKQKAWRRIYFNNPEVKAKLKLYYQKRRALKDDKIDEPLQKM